MSTFGGSRSQESLFDELLRPTATSTSFTTTATTTSTSSTNPSYSNQLSMPIFSAQDVADETRVASPPPSNSLTSERSGRLTLGKRSLAGIVISSGPGGHFETYEGTQKSAANRTNQESYTKCDVKTKPTSLLRVNRLATKNPPCPQSNVPAVTMPTYQQPVIETQNMSYPPVVADANWQQQSHFPDLTQLTYADMTSFTTFAPLSPMPEFFPPTSGKAVPTTLASKSPDLSSMHELSYSLLRSRPTIVDRREDISNSVAQGKYLVTEQWRLINVSNYGNGQAMKTNGYFEI
jgi:hypothetical protein